MARVVAEWDPAQARLVFRWSLRELLLAYVALLKRDALERYEADLQVWAALAPYQKSATGPPRPPRILRS